MKGRDILKGLTEAQKINPSDDPARKSRPTGSVRALKSELDKIAEEAASAKALKESLAKEGHILELSPELIDGANVSDRIPFLDDKKYEDLKNSIQTSGQQVPILVRAHPEDNERYEAAYGHRRIRAAKELGLNIRAIVRELSDQQMILAQGQENGPRLDLSFIERALYASRLLERGHDRETVCHALSVDKPEVSRLLNVVDNIDEDIILVIGPAHKIGRPRWVEFAKIYQDKAAAKKIAETVLSDDFTNITDSNTRFEELFRYKECLRKPTKAKVIFDKKELPGMGNKNYGWSQETKKGLAITVDNKRLSQFLLDKLPALLAEFEQAEQLKK